MGTESAGLPPEPPQPRHTRGCHRRTGQGGEEPARCRRCPDHSIRNRTQRRSSGHGAPARSCLIKSRSGRSVLDRRINGTPPMTRRRPHVLQARPGSRWGGSERQFEAAWRPEPVLTVASLGRPPAGGSRIVAVGFGIDLRSGILYVGTTHYDALEAGQGTGPAEVVRAVAGGRTTGFGVAAVDGHAGPE